MKIGISFDGFAPMPEVIDVARRADKAGIGSLWFAQHMGYREALVMAAAVAAVTERCRIVPAAISPYLWHPMPLAMSMASLGELAPGRVDLCVSVGNLLNLKEAGVEASKPVRVMRDYVSMIYALWAGETVRQDGEIHRLDGARLAFEVPQSLRIYVASTGPQVLKMSGEIADGVLLSGGLTSESCRACIAAADAGAQVAGRPLDRVKKAGFIYFSISNDGEKARARMQKKLAFLFRSPMQADNIKSAGLNIDHAAIMEAVMSRDLDRAAALLPEEAIDRFSVAGTPEACSRRLKDYLAVGIEEPILEISGDRADQNLALEFLTSFSDD